MLKNFLMKQMLSRQLKSLPPDVQERMMTAFEANPQFFETLLSSISDRLKKGENQMSAIQAVVSEHKAELEKLMKGA